MTNSYYGSYHKTIKNRATGYSFNEENKSFENLERVSWTIIEGAGDLMCNAEDFIKYYSALNSYKLISRESLEKTRTAYKLTDGSETGYGYGIAIGKLEEIPYVTHTGGITGYFTSHIYFPTEDIHAIIFTNCDGYMSKDPTTKIGKIIFNK
jgi:D-alanyl-D-alanine carboxypeptidase